MSDQKKFRITLWQLDTSTGWRNSAPKAIVYDAMAIGIQENANDVGSTYWTLNNDHAQISQFTPLDTHYEISRWSLDRSRWEFAAAGMIDDYDVTEFQTTFKGLDYMSVMQQIFTPLSNITFASAAPLNPNISSISIPTIFNQSDGGLGKDSIFGNSYATDSLCYYDYTENIGNNYISVNAVTVSGISETAKTIVVGTKTATVVTPYINLKYSVTYGGDVTGGLAFFTTPAFRIRINASPPASVDSGNAPIGEFGKIAEFDTPADSSSGAGRFTVTNRTIELFPYEAKQELKSALVLQGAASSACDAAMIDIISVTSTGGSLYTKNPLTSWPLRKGLTYTFQVYSGIYAYDSTRSGIYGGYPKWAIGTVGAKSTEVTLGQGTNDVKTIIARVFSNAQTGYSGSRIRYASLDVSGSTQTTHTTHSAGQPVVTYIGDIADIEMGAKTDGSKVIFGISKPINGGTYSGKFKLNTSVSSSASTAFALRYPENIRSFTFTPGFSRVRNDITIIPTDRYLSGSTAQGSQGAQIIGATASDSASLALYGRIPLVFAQGGFVNADAAQNQANRLLNSYKPENSKQVGLSVVVDGIDLWNGWDVGDSIRVTIKRGLVDIDEPFVIAGVRWFGESDGHEKVELDLVQGSAFAAAYAAPKTK